VTSWGAVGKKKTKEQSAKATLAEVVKEIRAQIPKNVMLFRDHQLSKSLHT
jgi:hypothetical protein